MTLNRSFALGVCAAIALAGTARAADPVPTPTLPSPPRVAPVGPDSKLTDSTLNVVRTMAQNPDLIAVWQPFSDYVLRHNSLPERDRELLINRIGWLNQSQYEFSQHVRVALRSGVTEAEIEMIKRGPGAPGWSDFDRALLTAADQLKEKSAIDDDVWAVLKTRYSQAQLMDVIVTCGQYNMISWYLNGLGVPLEPGVPAVPMTPPK